jgi:hypothetical protein
METFREPPQLYLAEPDDESGADMKRLSRHRRKIL